MSKVVSQLSNILSRPLRFNSEAVLKKVQEMIASQELSSSIDITMAYKDCSVLDKFFQLSSREQELLIPQVKAFAEAMSVVQKAFPDHSFATLQEIIAVPEAFDVLSKLTQNSDIQKLENEIAAFKKNDLSDENLDNYFKPYINRIGG